MRLNRKSIAVTTAVLTIAGSGAAFAYFSSGGSGDGTASVGTTGIAVTGVGTTDAGLVPGGHQQFSFNLTNTGTVAITPKGVTTALADNFGVAWIGTPKINPKPQCTVADFSLGSVTDGTGSNYVPALIGPGQSVTLYVQLNMLDRSDTAGSVGSGNQDNCMGVTPPLHVVVS